MRTGPDYRKVWRPDHPLAPPSGRVHEHRLVLWEKIGPGTHPCHWCGKEVSWLPGAKRGSKNALVVDHLDNDRHNNDPANLVPSCDTCNVHRTHRVRDDEVYVVTKGGYRHRGEMSRCPYCDREFVSVDGHRYCSTTCSARSKPLRTHCQYGHPIDGGVAGGQRWCRTCARDRMRERRSHGLR